MTTDAESHGGAEGRMGPSLPFAEAARTWLKIGLLGFGGPAGQIALMHRILVEEKRWIGEARFLHALNYCMLLPGPEAQQLATYVGWLLHRTAGGLVAGTLFVLPGAFVVLALSILYAEFGDVAAVEAVFFGVKAAVLAIVVEALVRIGRRALAGRAHWAIAAAAFVAIFFLAVPFPLIVLAAALAGYVGVKVAPGWFTTAEHGSNSHKDRGPPALVDAIIESGGAEHTRPSRGRAFAVLLLFGGAWLLPVAILWQLSGGQSAFAQIAIFFSQMAVVTFGGAYAVLAYVAQQAVEQYGWLAPGEMLDGLGLAETTPGPLILVLQFVGFLAAYREPGGLDPLLAGTLGAVLTLWVTFAPCFLWIFLGGPYVEALRGQRGLAAALGGITAAVVGVILNLALWFALHVLFAEVGEVRRMGLRLYVPEPGTLDPAALLLSAAALIALFRFRLGMLPTLGLAALAGLLWRFLA